MKKHTKDNAIEAGKITAGAGVGSLAGGGLLAYSTPNVGVYSKAKQVDNVVANLKKGLIVGAPVGAGLVYLNKKHGQR